MTDEEMSKGSLEESYTAIPSVVAVPTAAAQEARENPKVDELRERLVKDYPWLFSGAQPTKIHRIQVNLVRKG